MVQYLSLWGVPSDMDGRIKKGRPKERPFHESCYTEFVYCCPPKPVQAGIGSTSEPS